MRQTGFDHSADLVVVGFGCAGRARPEAAAPCGEDFEGGR